jgi:phage terminase large subunit-like protein
MTVATQEAPPLKRTTATLHKADRYIADVLSGRVLTSKWVRLQIERHVADLENAHERGLRFNRARGLRVIQFIERFIVGTEGEFDGKPFILEPWDSALLYILYGWEWTDARRRFKYGYCEIGRGNLKSTLASALCIYELISERGANVYSAATDRATAKVVFDTANLMVSKSPALKKKIRSYRNNLHITGTAAKFEPCSAEGKTLFAHSRPSFAVLDELHAHPSAEVWDAFVSTLGKRKNSMLFAITNSGYDRQSVCWKQREYSIRVLQGAVPDDTWFSWICGLDDEDLEHWEDERLWIKANPSIGHAVSIEDMRSQALKAKEDPSALNQFLRFRLSVWTESHSVWMPLDKWDLCNESVVAETLKGRQCFAGLDLSTTTDISAVVLLFPPFGDDKKWRVLPFFFLPEENITKRVKKDRVPYDVWQRQGLFNLTPGNVIDYDVIRAKINELAATYKIVEIAYDPYMAPQIVTQLQADGLTVVPFRQGDVSMTAPLKQLMELVLRKEFAHGDNPVLKWMAGNTVVKIGPTGLMKPDKEKSREKIDGISALLDALGRAMVVPIKKSPSFKPFFI